jgi:hypothetical protein
VPPLDSAGEGSGSDHDVVSTLLSCFLQLPQFVLFVVLFLVLFLDGLSVRLWKGNGHLFHEFAQAIRSDELCVTFFFSLFGSVEFVEGEDANCLVNVRPRDSGPGPKEVGAAGKSFVSVFLVDEVRDDGVKLGVHVGF